MTNLILQALKPIRGWPRALLRVIEDKVYFRLLISNMVTMKLNTISSKESWVEESIEMG